MLNFAPFEWTYTDKIADCLFLFGICFSFWNKIPAASERPGFTEWQRLEKISEDHLVQLPLQKQGHLQQVVQDLVHLVHFIFHLEQFPMKFHVPIIYKIQNTEIMKCAVTNHNLLTFTFSISEQLRWLLMFFQMHEFITLPEAKILPLNLKWICSPSLNENCCVGSGGPQ